MMKSQGRKRREEKAKVGRALRRTRLTIIIVDTHIRYHKTSSFLGNLGLPVSIWLRYWNTGESLLAT